MSDLRRQMAQVITTAGGEVKDDRYVLRPGIFLAGRPEKEQPSEVMQRVAQSWGLEPEQSHFMTMAEASAITTFMNPDSRSTRGPAYVKNVLAMGHHSIAGQSFVTLGLFGIPLETVIELLSHGLDTTARLTSSAVKVMDDPLFCIFGPQQERSIKLLEAILQVHQEHGWEPGETPPEREICNSFWPSNRAVSLFMGLRLIDWSKLLSKRSPRLGNEANLRFLCGLISHCLRQVQDFQNIIKSPEDYGWEEDLWH